MVLKRLTLTVPRRLFLATRPALAKPNARTPILETFALMPAADDQVRVCGCDGQMLVQATGGWWQGEWPKQKRRRVVTIPQEMVPNRKVMGIMDKPVRITVEHTSRSKEEVTVSVTDPHGFAKNGKPAAAPDGKVTGDVLVRYPVLRKMPNYERFALLRKPVALDPRKIAQVAEVGRLFCLHRAGWPKMELAFRRRVRKKRDDMTVLTGHAQAQDADETLRIILMGLRD